MSRDHIGRESGRKLITIPTARRKRALRLPPTLEQLEGRLVLSAASTTLAVSAAMGTYGGTATVTANLTSTGTPIAGESVDLHLGATDLGPVVTDTNGNATIPAASLAFLNAGTYTGDVTASFAGDVNYDPSSGSNDLTVTPAPLTITANNQTKVYGSALPMLTASYTGLVNGDTAASLSTSPTITTTATAASHVLSSPYSITTSGAADSNYTISYVAGSMSVTTAPLTITADDQSKVYGAALPTLTTSYTGFVNGDTPASLSTSPTITTTATTASHVAGSPYAITASGAVDTDYTISYVAGSMSVTQAPLTITADDQSKVYGAALPTLTASYTGFINGDTPASLSTSPTITTTATAASHVAGSPYAITVSGAVNTDYTISYVAGNMSVTTAPLTITADDQTTVYGSALPTLTASYTGFVNGDTAASLEIPPTITTTASQFSDVVDSPFSIDPSGADDLDYTISYVPGNLTITAAPLTVVADDVSKVYGQLNPVFTATVTGLLNDDDVSADFTSSVTQFSDVLLGGYAIMLSGLSGAKAGDYSTTVIGGSETDGTLTVTPAPLTIQADDQSKIYGQINPDPMVTTLGILNGDDVTAQYGIDAAQYSDVNLVGYEIVYQGLTGAKALDYSVSPEDGGSETSGTLTVTPAPLTVMVADQSKVYGQANPSTTGAFSGALNGDDVGVLYGTAAGQFSDVGGYSIAPTGLSGTKAIDYSYTVEGSAVTAGVLTVTPAPLAVMVDSQTKVYGQANPAFTGTIAGILNDDDVSGQFTSTASESSDVVPGGYAINISGVLGSKASDYIVTNATPGILTITPAPLAVTANNVSKVYGQANPVLAASYNGLVLGQDPSVLTGGLSETTSATMASHVGSYEITLSGVASTNYAISFANGTLGVTPAPLVVTVPSVTTTYGQAIPALTPSISGFVNGDTSASLATPVTVSTTASSASHVGIYPIIAGGASESDYSIGYSTGAVSVTPAVLTITANEASTTVNGPLPAFSVNYSGFVNGDTPASLTTPNSTFTTANDTSIAGIYAILPSLASSPDYSIVDLPAPLVVYPQTTPPAPSYNPGQVAFVTSLYHDILGRTPEDSGLAGWIDELNQGVTRASIAKQIYQSHEAVTYRVHHRHTVTQAKALSNAQQAQRQASQG